MPTLLYFHSLWSHHWLDGAAVAFAQYGLVIPIVAFVAGCIRRRAPASLVYRFLGAAVVAVGLDLVAGHFYAHQRPFATFHVVPLISHDADNAFPSDHSAVAAFIAAALFFVDTPLAIVSAIAAVLIGAARVYCFLHWPIDIIGGWLIGAAPAIAAAGFWRRRA